LFSKSLDLLASSKFKGFLDFGLFHASNFFRNISLKTARLCDVWLQNSGAINFVPFWGTPCT